MTKARKTLKDALRGRPRARWIVLGWIAGLASAVLSGLVTTAVQDHFADPTFDQRLDEVVGGAHASGFDVVSYRRVPLGNGREDTVLLVLRPRDRAQSDRLEVYTADGDDLRRSLVWQPQPDRPQAPYVENDDPGARRQQKFGYRIEVTGVGRAGTDQDSTRVLVEVRGADRYLHYPLILAWDALQHQHRLSAVMSEGFAVGPGTIYARDEQGDRALDTASLYMVRQLYGRSTTLRDGLHQVPPFETRGADALTFIRREGVLYLAAGFVVNAREIFSMNDVDCELRLIDERDTPAKCDGIGGLSSDVPAELNMKAWRLDPGDGDDTTMFCNGPRLIVHTRRDDDVGALVRNWRRYQRGGRAC
ncbi:hypothetical protein [Baekduia sp. Peel2402]|uniref:hypothetical protein n=1 Tax=Baekduia sp. Peel2402 TaxID=3458296 RepID=UPI00403EB7B9